jgi:hypothetical protein
VSSVAKETRMKGAKDEFPGKTFGAAARKGLQKRKSNFGFRKRK